MPPRHHRRIRRTTKTRLRAHLAELDILFASLQSRAFNGELFRHAQRESEADAATREALRYRTALYQGFRQLQERPLSTATAIEVCSTLKNQTMELRWLPGTHIGNKTTGEVIYTPPEGKTVIRDLLSNWERFIHAEDDLGIRRSRWPSATISLRPFTLFTMAMAAPDVSSMSFI